MLDLTWVSWFMGGVVAYYLALFTLSMVSPRPPRPDRDGPSMVILVPAHNEELVIGGTVASLLALEYARFLVLVVDDRSTDATAAIVTAAAAASGGRVKLIQRAPARRPGGKSGTLNAGFAVLATMVEGGDAALGGAVADDIVVGVVDADGLLDSHTLAHVAPFFSDSGVGAVQIGVRIANVGDGMLPCLQDMEFVGFSCLVQMARDRLGSVGLGGNGQFVRLSALTGLGRAPWAPSALTEDLALGLSLVEAGWRTRFCHTAFVAQQGLTTWRPLLRQRTRWIQGHYQCWAHLPALATRRRVRWITRIDLMLYLGLVTSVMVAGFSLVAGVAGAAGVFPVTNSFLAFLPPGLGHRVAVLAIGTGPLLVLVATYQRFAYRRLRPWEVPAYALAFSVYSYLWCTATIWAWARMLTGRWAWVKTPRVRVAEHG